ncbi:MAG: universal stress protein [Bacteroidetes bacterium]|nr:universal stress protein [Bacteroidota bacterium]
MKNYTLKTIVVPTDFSESADKALQHAIELCKTTNSKLVIVNVVELNLITVPAEMMSLGIITEEMIQISKISLDKLSEKIKAEHNISIESENYIGNVHDNIIKAAEAFKADLIIMGTHGASGIKEWLFGSNAFSVVNNTSIPVLTINLHSKTTNNFKKIVFPFNENLLTLQKVEQVTVLATSFKSSIFLLGYTTNENSNDIESIQLKGKHLSEQFANENIECSFSMVHGEDYADTILKFANDTNADLITIVSNRNHNVDKVFKTKPDKKLVNHSVIPVLSVPVE